MSLAFSSTLLLKFVGGLIKSVHINHPLCLVLPHDHQTANNDPKRLVQTTDLIFSNLNTMSTPPNLKSTNGLNIWAHLAFLEHCTQLDTLSYYEPHSPPNSATDLIHNLFGPWSNKFVTILHSKLAPKLKELALVRKLTSAAYNRRLYADLLWDRGLLTFEPYANLRHLKIQGFIVTTFEKVLPFNLKSLNTLELENIGPNASAWMYDRYPRWMSDKSFTFTTYLTELKQLVSKQYMFVTLPPSLHPYISFLEFV